MASKISINLDTSKENYILAKCKQNDDLTLEAFIYENGLALDLTNKEVTINCTKANNTYIMQNTEITKVNNKINAELKRDFTRIPGASKIEIVLVEGGKQNTTFSFYLEVGRSVIDGVVESDDSITALEKLQDAAIEIGRINEETQTLLNNAGAASKEDVNKINASLEQKASDIDFQSYKQLTDTIVNGDIQAMLNSQVVATDIANKLLAKEVEYAPRLTETEAQLTAIKNNRWNYKKIISISGTGQDEIDYVVKLNVHRGQQVGDITGRDIYLYDNCKTDFSDVRFSSLDGIIFDHYRVTHGNFEVIQDSTRIGSRTIQYKGKIYGLPPWEAYATEKTYVSEDNGSSWTIFSNNRSLIAIDSRGYFYASSGGIHIWRSIDNGKTWIEVLTLPSGTSARIQLDGWAEDGTGILYAGQYQNPEGAVIYKSVNGGENWTIAWQDNTLQHVHGVYVDPTTDYIYAGIDDATTSDIRMLRSTNHGITWEPIVTGHLGAFSVMAVTPYGRFFAGGAMAPCIGYTVYKTTDDINFVPVIRSSNSLQGLRILGKHIYGFGTSYGNSPCAEIYQMNLDGTDAKIINVSDYETDKDFKGWQEIGEAGTPWSATERQLILGYRDGTVSYKGSRVFDGGNHYQAIFHIKIPHLPANGMDICVMCGNPSAVDVSTLNTYGYMSMPNILVDYRFDEGTGTNVINHATNGQNANGTITHFSDMGGWNDYAIRNCGRAYPPILKGKSYKFNNGDYVQINTSTLHDKLIKNFSVVMWIKSDILNITDTLLRKGTTGEGGFRFQLGGLNGNLRVRIDVGSEQYVVANSPYGSAVGHECMVGIVVDNASPPNIKFICNGVISEPKALQVEIPYNVGSVRIGTSTEGSEAFTGDIGGVQIYGYQLTDLQIRKLYENRPIADVEPAVVKTLV